MTTMVERVTELTAALPAEKQAEVLDFVEFLRARTGVPGAAAKAERRRRLGTMAGKFTIAEDFDAPLPPELQRYFEGEEDGVLGKPGG